MKCRGAVAATVCHAKPAENKITYEPEEVVDLTLLEDSTIRVHLSDGRTFDAPKLVSVGWNYEAKDFDSFIFHGRRYRNRMPAKSKEAFRKKYWDHRLKMTSFNPNSTLDSGNASRNNATFPSSVTNTKEQAMKISRSDAVALMEALDYKTAARWSLKKLADKITGLPDILDEETEIEDKKLSKLLKEVLNAVENDDEIVVLEDEVEEEETEEEAPKPKKKGDKKTAKRGSKKASDDEETETEAEEEESVPVKPKPAKKGPGKRGVGVIATIIEELRKASAKKPTTKEKILAVLVKKFPDRDPKAMKSTVSSQIPSGLRTEKGLVVQSNDKGIWLDPE